MTLDQLAAGHEAVVEDIAPDHVLRPRLLEMGLTPGVSVSIIRVAPLGDPIQILVRRTRISLCKRDAAAVRCRTS